MPGRKVNRARQGTDASDARHFCLSSLRVQRPPRHNDRSMKLDSPLFNRIRVKPEVDARPRGGAPVCQWPECSLEGTHRAPKGRSREQRVLALLPRARARVQPFLQLLRRHERRRGRALPEGRRDRPPADLEDGLQRRRRRAHVCASTARPTRSTWCASSARPARPRAERPAAERARCATRSARRSTRSASTSTRPRPTSRRASRSW